MSKLNIEKMVNDFPSFEEHLNRELQNSEIEKEFLRLSLTDYAETGDYAIFFKDLESVIKARTSVSNLAKSIDMNRSNLSNILKGKVQPSFYTTMKILKGLGAEIEIKFAS